MILALLLQMAPLEGLVGTWTGEGQIAGQGKFTEQAAAEWALDRSFIRWHSSARLDDKPIGSAIAMIGWDAETRRFVSWHFSADGKTERRTMTFDADRKGWRVVCPSGDWRSLLVQTDADHFTLEMEKLEEGEWKPLLKAAYTRKKE